MSGKGYAIVAGVVERPGLAVGFVIILDIEGNPYWIMFSEEYTGTIVEVEVKLDVD